MWCRVSCENRKNEGCSAAEVLSPGQGIDNLGPNTVSHVERQRRPRVGVAGGLSADSKSPTPARLGNDTGKRCGVDEYRRAGAWERRSISNSRAGTPAPSTLLCWPYLELSRLENYPRCSDAYSMLQLRDGNRPLSGKRCERLLLSLAVIVNGAAWTTLC